MPDSLFDVSGRVAIVSGGSRGIGKAIAAALAQRGARVIISSRNRETLEATAEELSEPGNPVTPIAADVSETTAREKLVEQVVAECGRIDILLNVAGINKRGRIEDYTEADYDWIMGTNLKGAFVLSQLVGRHMIGRRQGKIINIASVNSLRPLVGVGPYAMAKAALCHMTRSMAAEWAPHNVQVNALGPGYVMTDLTASLWQNDAMRQWVLQKTPARRPGVPEDMVGTALFLASSASDWVTGQTIYVDGGWTAAYVWPIFEEG